MKQEIIDLLKEIVPGWEFTGNEHFVEEGFLDSFDMVLFTDALERKFKVKIDGMDINKKNFNTIDDIIRLIQK
jgi:acyl carrier protein